MFAEPSQPHTSSSSIASSLQFRSVSVLHKPLSKTANGDILEFSRLIILHIYMDNSIVRHYRLMKDVSSMTGEVIDLIVYDNQLNEIEKIVKHKGITLTIEFDAADAEVRAYVRIQ